MAKVVDYAETWYRVWCPECDTDNWYCNGNEQDLSGVDIEAVECWKCGNKFWIGEPQDLEFDNIENAVIEKGIKMTQPNPLNPQE